MSSLTQRKQSKSSAKLWQMLDDYQQDAVEFAIKAKTAALFFEQGTGKTWIATAVAQRLTELERLSALFVVPLTNIDTSWQATLGAQLPGVTVCRDLKEFRAANGHRILLTHYGGLPRILKHVAKMPWTLIMYDESQRLKNRSTGQSRHASKLRDAALYKLILSGTPIESSPQDLWAQFRFLNPNVFGARWKDFEDEYFEPINIDLNKYQRGTMAYERAFRALMIAKNKRPFRQDKLPQLLSLIKPFSCRVTKEVLSLPPLTFVEHHVKLRGQHRVMYDELEQDLVSELASRRYVTAPLKITKIAKLHQMCGGFVFDDEGQCFEVGRTKLRRLLHIARKEATPFVVFCRYLQEVEAISEALKVEGFTTGCLVGGVKRADRTTLINRFQSGKLDVLIAQVRTGGVGVDLFRACVAVFYSTTYSFVDFEQAVARVHRRGQKKPVRIHLIMASNTIDEEVYSAIWSKRKVSDTVLTRLKGGYHGRRKADVQVRCGRPGEVARHSGSIGSRRAA